MTKQVTTGKVYTKNQIKDFACFNSSQTTEQGQEEIGKHFIVADNDLTGNKASFLLVSKTIKTSNYKCIYTDF